MAQGGTKGVAAKAEEKAAKAAQTSDAAADKEVAKVSYKFKGKTGANPTLDGKGRLSYPYDKVYTDHTDYVKFTFVEYNPPFSSMHGNY